MSTKRINVTTILPPSALFIGYVAENGVTNVEFDVSAWVTMYGSGTATLIMKRWGDANPYPIALEVDNEGLATWTISATDTAKKGFAYAQLRYEAGTKVKKSPIYTLKIGESLGSPAEAPDQYEDWIDALTHLAAQAMAEALDIEDIPTDKTLTVDGGIADAKSAGNALALKADKSTTYTKTEVDQMIEDVEVETDTTLAISGAPADAAETGRQIGLLKADLGAELFGGRYVKYNGLTGYTFGATDSRPAFCKNGNRFSFNGTFGTAAYYYVKLSEAGTNNITTSANTARNWPKEVSFIEGHTYKARFNLLSGSHSGEDNINVKLMLSSGTNVTIQESEEVTFTPGAVTSSVVFYSEPSVSYDEAEFVFTIEDITEESLTTTARTVPGAINELGERIDDIEETIDKPIVPTTTMGLAYSWWVNNRVVDSYGNLYFGYISDDAMIGVCCRYPDGSIVRQDLFVSEDCDDHNAPSVIIVTKDGGEYICVIGSTGHNTDNKVNCYISKEPNSITDGFDDKTFTVDAPTGYVYECSYSQAFFDSYTRSGETYNRISNFFRVRQRVSGQSQPFHMTWVCAVSDDYGDTWTLYRVFTVDEDTTLFYMTVKDTKSPWMKRIILQPNTTYANYKPISAGAVNLYSLNILDSTMNSAIGSLSAFDSTKLIYDANDQSIQITNYDDFAVLVPFVTDYLYRILDVWDIDNNRATFLFAKTAEPEDPTAYRPKADINDWILYRYDNGTITEIAHLGGAFFKGSCYVTGASFFNDADHIIYSQNNSPIETVTDGAGVTRNRQETDGAHSLHVVEIADNVVTSDKVIRISNQLIARPARYDRGSIMMLCGKYREGEGTKYLTWHFGVQFLDVVN